jgi:hypothetical protein
MGGRGQGFLVSRLAVIGEGNPCPYVAVSFPKLPLPERGSRAPPYWLHAAKSFSHNTWQSSPRIIMAGIFHIFNTIGLLSELVFFSALYNP